MSTMFSAIVLIIGGLLACYGLIIGKAPHLKDEFDKVVPYQWFFWVILLILWLIDLFMVVKIIWLLQVNMFFGILSLLWLATKLVLWFVLSFGLVTKYVLTEKSDAKEKTESIYNMLIIAQVPFGIIAILLWFVWLIFTFIY